MSLSKEKAHMQARHPDTRLQRVSVLGTEVIIFLKNILAISYGLRRPTSVMPPIVLSPSLTRMEVEVGR